MLDRITFELDILERLDGEPVEDSATIKKIRQSKKHRVRRVAHRFHPGVAARIICWFPPGDDTVVVALFVGDKAVIGDLFYDSVGDRADIQIEKWIRETEQKP